MKEIHDFKVLERRQLGSRYFALVLEHGGRMQPVVPGQFVEVLVEGSREVMLRRPISVHDVDEERGTLTLLIQIVGNGTRKLAELQAGDKLNMVYPLGHGFSLPLSTFHSPGGWRSGHRAAASPEQGAESEGCELYHPAGRPHGGAYPRALGV